MNLIKCEKLEKSMAELQFSIDAETYKAEVLKVFKTEGKKYTVQGFRKGKAPRHLIERMYGPDVFTYDAINNLFPAAFEAAVKEAGIEPVGRPEVTVESASDDQGAVLTVKVAVKPEVKLGAYNGLTVEKTVHTVQESAVDAELKRVQERNARELTREGAAENGDIVDIDFEGFTDGVAFEGGKAEHYHLTLGSGSFIPGFEDQIVGHSAGEEFDVNVTFPEQYQADELAGKPAVFKIKLHEVKYKELPALDDELAKDCSEYDTLEEFKESIRKSNQEQLDKQDDLAVENALVDQVIGGMEAEIPQAMYDVRMDELVNDFAFRVEQQGPDPRQLSEVYGPDHGAVPCFLHASGRKAGQDPPGPGGRGQRREDRGIRGGRQRRDQADRRPVQDGGGQGPRAGQHGRAEEGPGCEQGHRLHQEPRQCRGEGR